MDILTGGKPVLTEIKYSKPGNAPLNLEPGTYDIQVVPTGKTDPAVIDLKGTQLQADIIYTVLAVEPPGSKAVKPLVLTTISIEMAKAGKMAATMQRTMQSTMMATAAKYPDSLLTLTALPM